MKLLILITIYMLNLVTLFISHTTHKFVFIEKNNNLLITALQQKHDIVSTLHNCPLNGYALFPDAIIRKAEDENH